MEGTPRLLCIVYEQANTRLAGILAREGRRSGRYDSIAWSPYCLPADPAFHEAIRQAGSVYVEEATALGGLGDVHGTLSGWLSAKPARLPVVPSHPLSTPDAADAHWLPALPPPLRDEALRAADRQLRRIAFCEDWLVRLGIDAVVFAEDNVDRDSHAWIAAAKRRGIRTVVCSYGALSIHEAEHAYRGSAAHAVSGQLRAIFQDHLPHWLRIGDGYAITRLPAIEALGRVLSGCDVFNPWLVNSGALDMLALESPQLRNDYLAQGFPADRLRVTGHPLNDDLASAHAERAERRARRLAAHGMDANAPLVVVAMPPNHVATRRTVFTDYAELTGAFFDQVRGITGANVLVSAHPSITQEERRAMAARGIVLESASAAELIPLADLFIASVSSTIKWALALGIPTIDFDCYRYDYPDYEALPQVVTVRSRDAFAAALQAWTVPATRDAMALAARGDAPRWGAIDGRCLDRLLELCLAPPSSR